MVTPCPECFAERELEVDDNRQRAVCSNGHTSEWEPHVKQPDLEDPNHWVGPNVVAAGITFMRGIPER